MPKDRNIITNNLNIKEEIKALDIGNKIRNLRQQRGFTLQNVSDLSALSKPLLSQIENNIAAPPIATLLKIAKALHVNIGYFFQEFDSESRLVVVRRKDRKGVDNLPYLRSSDVGYSYESLAYPMVDKHMEPFMVKIDPREEEDLLYFNHKGEEFLFLIEGRIEFRTNEQKIKLEYGDSLYFDSSVPHALRALGKAKAKAIVVIFPS